MLAGLQDSWDCRKESTKFCVYGETALTERGKVSLFWSWHFQDFPPNVESRNRLVPSWQSVKAKG